LAIAVEVKTESRLLCGDVAIKKLTEKTYNTMKYYLSVLIKSH
jgi:hypothetical protein